MATAGFGGFGSKGDITNVNAGDGLAGGGSTGNVTVQLDYSGSDSFILDCGPMTAPIDQSNDKVVIYDNSAGLVKYVSANQLTGATSVTPAGSDTQVQYNNGGGLGGAASLSYVDGTGYLGVGASGGDVTHRLTLPNTATVAGRAKANAFVTYSSRRYKENIETLDNPMSVLKQLDGVSFSWKEGGQQDYGFIAEEVGKILPDIVEWEENGVDAISMDYVKIISFLVEGMKQQEKRIDELEKKFNNLYLTFNEEMNKIKEEIK